LIYQPIAILSIVAIAIYSVIIRANSAKPFFDCAILESIYLIVLVTLILYIALHIYFFIVIVELYLEIKAAEPALVGEDVEAIVVKEEELQLLETPKAENADETDQADEEKPKEEEAKEDGAAKSSRIRCPELPKCPSLKCPSWGNCVGPDNFQ
jgi:flagellar biosynthesis/type III secretory pathway M-ring protein FliF/YscJ